MAWTVSNDGMYFHLVPDGSTSFDWDDYFPQYPDGIPLKEIDIKFSAANDIALFRTNGSIGTIILNMTTLDGGNLVKLFHGLLTKLYIAHGEQTYNTAANWLIMIQAGS